MIAGVGCPAVAGETERSSLLTDAQRMKALFQERLPGFASGALIVGDCQIVHTRYRTSEKHRRKEKAFLSVCYQLDVRDVTTAGRGVQLVHAKAYHDGRSAPTFARARTVHPGPPRFGDAVVLLGDLDVVVWAFPNDPKLPHLPEVIDPVAVLRRLPYHALPVGFDSADQIGDVAIEVVRYKPEVRCITRYRLHGGKSSVPQTLTIYGKTFGHAHAPEILRRIESVCRLSAGDPQSFIVPRPLGCAVAVKTVWQDGLSGASLVDVIDRDNWRQFLEDAARGLASLHRVEVPGLSRTTPADGLDAVRGETSEIIEAFPRLRARLACTLSKLETEAARLPRCREGLVHGDFLLKQLVVHGGRLGVFDFDNFSIGDPIQDLANFIVDLGYQQFNPRLVNEMAATFLRSYCESVDWEVPLDRVNWHAGVQLLRDAYYFHKRRHRMPGFEVQLERLFVQAEHPAIDAES